MSAVVYTKVSEHRGKSREMGALENRNRLAMVATTKGLDGFDFSNILPVRTKESSISEILEDVSDDSERWKSFDYLNAKQDRDKAAGKGFMRQILNGSENACGTIGQGYAKCRSTEPFLKNERTGLERLFTPTEHARLKGIPESLVAGLSDTIAHQVLGQSVIHPMFEAVGALIGKAIISARQLSSLRQVSANDNFCLVAA